MTQISAGRGDGRGADGAASSSRARRREIEALSADRFGVHFTADVELRDLIERARALVSHRLPKGELSSLMKLALTAFIRQEEKRRFAVGGEPRKAAVGNKPCKVVLRKRPEGSPVQAASAGSTLRKEEASAPRGDDTASTPPGGARAESKQFCAALDRSRSPRARDTLPRR
jgi:hypothetical protein